MIAYDSSGSVLKTYASAVSFTSSAPANSTTTLFSASFTIAHDDAGYAKISLSVTYDASDWNLSKSTTKTLTTIARASSITSAAAVTLGNACSVKWTPASKSFAYKLKFVVGSKSYTTGYISPGSTSAYTYTGYTMAISTWAPYITASTSATCTVTLYTYSSSSSSSSIGTSSETFTVTVPSTVVPSVSFTTAEANSAVTLGVYVQGKSKVKVTSTGTTAYGAAISSYAVKVGSSSYSGSSVTSGTLSTTGSVTISVTVTDARGRTATATKTITVYAYSTPSITKFTAQRVNSDGTEDTSGTYVKLTYTYSVSTVNSKNTCSMTIKQKDSSESSFSTTVTSDTSLSASAATYMPSTTFSIVTSYDFQITITDAFTTATKTASVSTAVYPISIYSTGTGVAICKIAESESLFDVGVATRLRSTLTVDGKTAAGGRITATCTDIAFYHKHSTTGYNILFGVGSGGYNRGIYDGYKDEWMLYRDSSSVLYAGATSYATYVRGASVTINVSGTTFKPYYQAGDSFSATITTGGYVTSSSAKIYFLIPTNRPIIGSPSVTVSGGLTLRQDGSYTHGSSASATVTPSSYAAYLVTGVGIRVIATMSSTTNAVNNATIGVAGTLTITFS